MLQVKPVADLLPIDEMNARLHLIQVIRDRMVKLKPDRPLNHIQFCYLMGMSLGDLGAISVQTIYGLEKLTAYFFNSQQYFIPSRSATPSTRSRDSLCAELDQHRCIVTGLTDPQVCHIVPFAWNQDQEHLEKTRKILGKVDTFVFPRNADAHETSMEIINGIKSSDKPWNLLCLSPQLHTWWGKAFFGLKYDSATLCEDDPDYSIISLQFVWMPSNVKAMATDQIDLNVQRDPSTALGSYLNHRYGQGPLSACMTRDCATCQETQGVKCHDISSNRPVESGTIVKVKRLTKDRHLLEHVIKLQWSIISAAALSGGPLIGDDCVSSDSEEEEMECWEEDGQDDSIDKVDKWLELQNSEDGASASSKLRGGYPKSI
ncbi:hypothetical protein H9Q74_011284 [Fusarium xylarioides]|nr:hypothetical protein H9Q71_011533 [Fusarium xylarioides]KAG5816120.1 hypothetical protein H9Q74_011284 [Fusarium xylarioides]